jgi:hypothetical protein
LDLLDRGLAQEFPNPGRAGCPDSAVLRGIAHRTIPLSQADQWLNHLGSCSPCFHDFRKFQAEAARRRRRMPMALAAAAVIIIVIGALFWVRTPRPTQSATITIDLRERSISRGENPTHTGQPPLELSHLTRHLVLDLPIGSREGNYEVALLGGGGRQIRSTTGIAQFENHTVILRADIDLAGVSPGLYILGIRQIGLDWTRYPVRVR